MSLESIKQIDISKNRSEILPDPISDRQKKEIPSDSIHRISDQVFNRLHILEDDIGLGFHSGSQKRSGFRLAMWTWMSATIDGLILLAVSCLFVILFSFLVKAAPASIFSALFKHQHLSVTLVSLFTVTAWSYLIFMRLFIGASIGEWACSLRLGKPIQQYEKTYLVKVVFRTTLIIGTGIILLPLISLIFSKDIAGSISGLKIYSLQ